MIKKAALEGIGVPVTGPEENYVQFENDIAAITDLAARAEVERVTWKEATAFEAAGDPYWERYREDYRNRTGRQLPKVYRMVFTCEAEELSEEEARAWWEKLRRES